MDQQDPQQGQAPAQQGQGGDDNQMQQMIMKVPEILQHISEFADHIQNQKAAAIMQQILQLYGQFVQTLQSGDQEEMQEGKGQGQTVPMEAGGNKGAVPAQF